MNGRPPGRWWMMPAAALLGLALAFLLAELAARAIPDPPPIPPQFDIYAKNLPVLHDDHDLKVPHVMGTYKGVTFYSNRDGFRGPDFEVPKPPGVFRIAVVGDSVTMGSGVRYKQAYPYLLQEALNARKDGRRYEVLNFGIDGYSFNTSLAALKYQALPYDPDMVVYGFTVNDLEGPLYHKSYDPAFAGWTSPSKFLTLLWAQYLAFRDVYWPAWGTYMREVHDNFFDHAEAFDQFRFDMTEFAKVVHGRGQCAVMLVHTQLSALNSMHPWHRVYAAAREVAEANGVYVVESFPAFAGRNGRDLWVAEADPHPNPEGHEIFAKTLLAGLDRLPASCWGRAASSAEKAGP